MITLLQAQQSAMPSIIMMVALFAIVYFFMIRPQSKRQKEIENFRRALTVGQDVVTTGGLHGTIKAVADTTVTLRIATGVEVVFDKSAIIGEAKK